MYVSVNGKDYELRFDLYAMEQLEEAFGSLKEMFAALTSGKNSVKTVSLLFKVMANSALSFDGKEETVTGNEIKHMHVSDLKSIMECVKAAMQEGMKAETMDGNEADDSVHDGYLEEIERKNVLTGGQSE